jgi:hypothetical protein
VTDQQPGEPSGFARLLATGAMLHRLGVFKRQPNQPPRSARDLGQPQTAEAIARLLDAGAHNPQIGRVTSLRFDVDAEPAAETVLRPLWQSRHSGVEEVTVSLWIDWTAAGPTDVYYAKTRIGRLTPTDAASLADEAHDAEHGNAAIRVSGFAKPNGDTWELSALIRRVHPDSVYDKPTQSA